MIKRILLIIALLPIISSGLFSEKVTVLEGIEKPTDMLCYSKKLFIMDGAQVKVFDIHDGKSMFKFAGKGEGPGEIKMSPFQTNTLTFHNGSIGIDSLDRVIFYSTSGEFIKEVKKGGFLALQVKPLGNNYVVKRVDRGDKKVEYITLDIYDRNMKKVREIARQRSSIQLDSVQMVPDSIHFCIKGNILYVERSDKGAVIEAFDESGNLTGIIRFDHEKIKVRDLDKTAAVNRYKNDSLVKQIGFENLKKRINFLYSEYFPEIGGIQSYKDSLIIKTFKRSHGKTLYLIIDQNGKVFKKLFLPDTWEGEMISHLNGVEPELFTFYKNYFYYIYENIDTEEYELHRIKI